MDIGEIEVHLAILSTFAYFFSIIEHGEGRQLPHISDTMKATVLQWPQRLNANCSEVLLLKAPARPLMALTMPWLNKPLPQSLSWDCSLCLLSTAVKPEQLPHCLRACSSSSFSWGPFSIACLNANYCICFSGPARPPPAWRQLPSGNHQRAQSKTKKRVEGWT